MSPVSQLHRSGVVLVAIKDGSKSLRYKWRSVFVMSIVDNVVCEGLLRNRVAWLVLCIIITERRTKNIISGFSVADTDCAYLLHEEQKYQWLHCGRCWLCILVALRTKKKYHQWLYCGRCWLCILVKKEQKNMISGCTAADSDRAYLLLEEQKRIISGCTVAHADCAYLLHEE